MNLLPQDVLVMIKLALAAQPDWTYEQVAHDLGMSASMAYSAIRRAQRAALYNPDAKRPRRKALEEFLVHGVKYAYPPDIGTVTRGVPTAFASPMLRNKFVHDGTEMDAYVWPHPLGEQRGIGLSPLYKSVPDIAMRDRAMHAALGLLDAIRIGRARERSQAESLLLNMLRHGPA